MAIIQGNKKVKGSFLIPSSMSNINNIKTPRKTMENNTFLQRLFQAYYTEKKEELNPVSTIKNREFGFIPWNKPIMIRHTGFNDIEMLRLYLQNNAPRHVYSSGAVYEMPENTSMDEKGYQGCDLIIDIDVDHFYTPCKEDHDIWTCKKCDKTGKGMIEKCPKCGSLKLESLNWICERCLERAKEEIIKLLENFLLNDFNIPREQIHIAFSGHRGYHLKIENEKIRTLDSNERREIVDYVTGHNISFEVLGLKEIGQNIYGLMHNKFDWSGKIIDKIKEIIENYSHNELRRLLDQFDLHENRITSFINSKDFFYQTISNNNRNIWNLEGFGLISWKKFLRGIVDLIGAEIDEPVTIDTHRLIRYPGSLHGKTGFEVQELSIEQLYNFHPLKEVDEKLDPIVFKSKKNTQKIRITAPEVPQTVIKGEEYGPYRKDEIIELPNHIAIFLLCKEVALLVE
jgi:DNA primase small subunit